MPTGLAVLENISRLFFKQKKSLQITESHNCISKKKDLVLRGI